MASSSSSTKKNKGRQKVDMVRMEKDSNRLVTFSKRRCGLFKKANELCTLCGAEAAIIVFSPGKKAYTFGNPSVDTILKRFILSNSSSSSSSSSSAELDTEESFAEMAQRSACVNDLNLQLSFINTQMEIVQKTGEEINGIKKAKQQLYWWDRPVEELSIQHLLRLNNALEELKNNVLQHGKYVTMLEASNAVNHFPVMGINHHPMLPYFDGAMFNPNGGFVGFGKDYY